jgi:tetratricopeptide (TPR) repeat protein
VVKNLGDGILAMFDSASDAVSAAVAVQQAAYAHARAHPDQPLDIRIGLSGGDVTVEDGDCFGTPVIEASRLCAAATGGQILAAELVRLLARGRGGHVFTAGGERELKGLPEPVPVAIVGWEPPELTTAAVPFPSRLSPTTALPFAGRGPQLESLVHAWKEAATGERRVVLISGEPGIGKTRLAAEAARVAHDQGATVLYGRCDEDMGVPFQPFVEALEQVVANGPVLDALGRHGGELVRLVPELEQAVAGLAPALRSDPETERYRLFDAVAAWLAAASHPAGLVLVLDDLHWAEKPTLLLLRHLIRSPEPMRLLVLGTYRDTDLDRAHPLGEVLADLRREPSVARLALTGLDVEGIVALLASASGERMDVRATDLAQLLWAETEGNPFFVQEVLRSLVESGRLVQRDGVWTTDLEITELGIPEGVREVVGRRLSRLSEAANQVLAAASVIGALVDVELLTAVAGHPEDAVLDALDEAAAASLLRESSSGVYEFTHALVRTTLYDELSATRRARRHRQVAEALEARGDDDPVALAHHFGRSGAVDERAVDYAARAGARAIELLAFDQAVAFYAQGLEAADDIEADDARRLELLIGLGTAQRFAGSADYRRTLLDAAALARTLGDADAMARAAFAHNRGFWSLTGVNDAEYVAVIEQALAAVGPEDSVVRARLLALLAVELTWEDRTGRRFEMADEAVAMARRVGDDACLLDVRMARVLSCWIPENVPALVADQPDLLALAVANGDPQSQFYVNIWASIHLREVGEMARANEALDEAERLLAQVDLPTNRWVLAIQRCSGVCITGSGDELEAAALHALELGQAADQPDALLWFAPQLFVARLSTGRIAEVLPLIRQQLEENPGLPTWRTALCLSLTEAGELDEAAELLTDLLAVDDPLPHDFVWLYGHCNIGIAASAVGTPEQAARQYERLAPYAGRFPSIGLAVHWSVDHVLATLAARAGWADRAEGHFADAVRLHEAVGARCGLARARVDWARFLLDQGEPERARELLVQALDLATEMGMTAVTARATALLGHG